MFGYLFQKIMFLLSRKQIHNLQNYHQTSLFPTQRSWSTVALSLIVRLRERRQLWQYIILYLPNFGSSPTFNMTFRPFPPFHRFPNFLNGSSLSKRLNSLPRLWGPCEWASLLLTKVMSCRSSMRSARSVSAESPNSRKATFFAASPYASPKLHNFRIEIPI